MGGAGNDWLEGHGNDQLRGGSGDDVLISLGGDDTLRGGAGNDVLQADGSVGGNSRLYGGTGNDYLSGNSGDQLMFGGSGADTFHFGHSLFRADQTTTTQTPVIGDDRIVDFELGVDTISIHTRLAQSMDDLAIEQYGATTRITLSDSSTITLNNTDATDLSASAFAFTATATYSDLLAGWQTHLEENWHYATANKQDISLGHSQGEKLFGNHQDNRLSSGTHSSEYLDGGAGNDYLVSAGGNDILVGGEGNDAFVISERFGIEKYGDSHDTQITQVEDYSAGVDTLTINFYSFDRKGIDLSTITPEQVGSSTVFTFSDYFQVVLKNTDISSISNEQISFGIIGNSGSEEILGNDAANEIEARDGHDTIHGYGGDDIIDGGRGNDTIFGGAGNDQIWGDSGSDKLYGGDGDDKIYDTGGGYNELDGGAGNDLLVTKQGNHTLTGGDGEDTFEIGAYNSADQNIIYDATITDFQAGSDTINMTHVLDNTTLSRYLDDEGIFRASSFLEQVGDDVLLDASKNVTVTLENIDLADISGDQFNFTLVGRNSANHIIGWDGNDTLMGRSGNDTLEGGKGNDWLQGDAGEDTLTGGEGADTFVVSDERANYTSGVETDIITDFVIGEDKIAFDDYFHKQMDFNDFIITQQGGDTLVQMFREYTAWDELVTADHVNVLLKGIDASDVSANDFEFFYSA
ncbi:hypothetical protein L4D06_03165 [Enterovibrio makurazakiensis]